MLGEGFMMFPYKCLNCGLPLDNDDFSTSILPYCSLKCAEQIELAEYLPDPDQYDLDLED